MIPVPREDRRAREPNPEFFVDTNPFLRLIENNSQFLRAPEAC